jgi:hypothetical protein
MAKRKGSRSRTHNSIDDWLKVQPREVRRGLRRSVSELKKLYRRQQHDDFVWWHDVGSLVAALIPKGRRHYGENVIELVVQQLEPDRKPEVPRYFLYRARALADTFTREEALELTEAGLPKCHLQALLSVEDETQRQRFLARCLEESWSVRYLRQKIQDAKGRKRSGLGRKPTRPKPQSAGVAIPNISRMADNWMRNHDVWFNGASCPFRKVRKKDCDEAILRDAQSAVRKLKEMQGAIKDGLVQLNSFVQELKERLPA